MLARVEDGGDFRDWEGGPHGLPEKRLDRIVLVVAIVLSVAAIALAASSQEDQLSRSTNEQRNRAATGGATHPDITDLQRLVGGGPDLVRNIAGGSRLGGCLHYDYWQCESH